MPPQQIIGLDDEGNPVVAGDRGRVQPIGVDDEGNPIYPGAMIGPVPGTRPNDYQRLWPTGPEIPSNERLGRMATDAIPGVTGFIGGLAGAAAGPFAPAAIPAFTAMGAQAGVPIREAVKALTSQRKVLSGADLAEASGVEGAVQGGSSLVGMGIGKGFKVAGLIPPVAAAAGPEKLAREVGIPVSNVPPGQPIRRPSSGVFAQLYAQLQQGKVLNRSLNRVNQELRGKGVPELQAGTSPQQIVRQADEHIARQAEANIAARSGANQVARDRAELDRLHDLARAEGRVRRIIGRSGSSVPNADLGQQFRTTAEAARRAARTKLGGAIEKPIKPFYEDEIDITSLLDDIDKVAQQDLPVVQEFKKRLMALRIKESRPNTSIWGNNPTMDVVTNNVYLKDLENLSQNIGSRIPLGAAVPRASGPTKPLRKAIFEKILEALPAGERRAYIRANTAYGKKYGDIYTRGVMKGQLGRAGAATPSKTAEKLFSDETMANPEQLSRMIQSLGSGPQALAVRQQAKANFVNNLLKTGDIENLPKTLDAIHPDTLNKLIGARDARALRDIATQVMNVPRPPGPVASLGPSPLATEISALTSPDLLDLQEALRASWKPLSPHMTGLGAAARGIAGTQGVTYGLASGQTAGLAILGHELYGLIKTIVAYHPDGGLAQFNEALAASLKAGTANRVMAYIGSLANKARTAEENGKISPEKDRKLRDLTKNPAGSLTLTPVEDKRNQ